MNLQRIAVCNLPLCPEQARLLRSSLDSLDIDTRTRGVDPDLELFREYWVTIVAS